MSEYILLTGSTGLLGQYLLRDLLIRGYRLALVLRPGRKETIHHRLESILQMWEEQLGRALPRPTCFEGNVADANLGLNQAAREWIAQHCDRVIHNAAVLTFHGTDRSAEPWRTNLGGTRNVLNLCRDLAIDDLHYVSTAYVCGLPNDGRVAMEDELDQGQPFRNDYERAKFEAEKLVREDKHLKKLTVYRPAIIVGDSRTGYMATYHGLGMYLKLMSVMIWNLEADEDGVRHTPLHLPCTGDEPRNPVTVDWVSAVMCRLFDNPEAHGGTYHITPDTPMTARQLIDYTATYFDCTGVVFDAREIGVNEFDTVSHAHLSIYHDYLRTDPTFDRTNMLKFAQDLPSPVIDEAMIHRFLRYGDADRWGKRRRPMPSVPYWSCDVLSRIAPSAEGTHGNDFERTFGLDILGPGGGQFRLALAGGRIISIRPGLPDSATHIVELGSERLGHALGIEKSDSQFQPTSSDIDRMHDRLVALLHDTAEPPRSYPREQPPVDSPNQIGAAVSGDCSKGR